MSKLTASWIQMSQIQPILPDVPEGVEVCRRSGRRKIRRDPDQSHNQQPVDRAAFCYEGFVVERLNSGFPTYLTCASSRSAGIALSFDCFPWMLGHPLKKRLRLRKGGRRLSLSFSAQVRFGEPGAPVLFYKVCLGFCLPATKAGCPIQARFWLEWDTTALEAPFAVLAGLAAARGLAVCNCS